MGLRQKEAARKAEEAAVRQAEAEAAQQRREAYEAACRIEEARIQKLVANKEVRRAHSLLQWTNIYILCLSY